MNSQELRALQEAYSQVYELDENRMASRMGKMPSGPAKVGKATHSIKDLTPSKPPSPEEKAKARKALGIGEEIDLYDVILSHLLDEGYADTEQAAEAIMVNMSEDWRESISELYKGKHGQSETEYMAGRSDAGKRISGDDKQGPASYASRWHKDSPVTKPGAKPQNVKKLSSSEKDEIEYRKANLKNR